MLNFSVTRNGKAFDPSLYTWDNKTKVFSTNKNNLIITGDNIENITFITGSTCVFNIVGSDCTFITESDCKFNTGSDCIFITGHTCTFKTGSDCKFNTKSKCTFKTGNDCIFDFG
jgi:hypothetical protein